MKRVYSPKSKGQCAIFIFIFIRAVQLQKVL